MAYGSKVHISLSLCFSSFRGSEEFRLHVVACVCFSDAFGCLDSLFKMLYYGVELRA